MLTLLYWPAPSLPGPHLSAALKDRDAGAVTLEPLANYDPDGNFVPTLAPEIPTLENGGFPQDLMSITWRLKEDLKWSDGSDMTAEDVRAVEHRRVASLIPTPLWSHANLSAGRLPL